MPKNGKGIIQSAVRKQRLSACKATLTVEQLEGKLTADAPKFPVLAADKDTEIKNMRTDAIPHFHIRLQVGHAQGAYIYTLILHITGVLHQMTKQQEGGFIGEMPAYIPP